MSIEITQMPQEIKNQIEASLYNFLLEKAENGGFSQSYTKKWVEYLMDFSRGEKTAKHLAESFNISTQEKEKALDIGCGLGSLLLALQKYFEQVCGLDIEEYSVEWSKKRVPGANVICTNANQIPWPDEEFKLIIANDVFEHLPFQEQEQAASEIMRVLKPGGYGYIEVPNRFQILDEHNNVFFGAWFPGFIRQKYVNIMLGAWLPEFIRQKYVNIMSVRKEYIQCWERSSKGWKHLFESQGFQVNIKPRYPKGIDFLRYFFVPPNRFHLYLTKK